MMHRTIIFICGLLGLALTSCLNPETYPETPWIGYNQMIVMSDSLRIDIDFTDGDGDIGLSPSDTTDEYALGSRFYFNLFLEYWEWNHDIQQWERGYTVQGDPIEFNNRIPVITPSGRNKALNGVIRATIEPIYYDPSSPYSDTIRYRIQLADRSLKTSEWITTPEIWNGVVQPQ